MRTPADHQADHPDCPVCAAQLGHLVGRIAEVADAAVVVDGSADDLVAKLVDDGWTWDGTAESVAGKRLRVLVPPPGWTGSADPAG